MRIAVIDNDTQQRTLIAEALASASYDYEIIDELSNLLARIGDGGIDLLVYHWQPEIEGLRQLLECRRELPALPILLLSGRSYEHELATLLSGGYCDYQIKPLRRNELLIRLKVLAARAHPEEVDETILEFGEYLFDIRSCQLKRAGEPVALTQKEFDLALLFFRNLGRPLSRATILEAVWPQDTEFSSRSMDTHVSRVRSKLGLGPDNGFRLAPVYSYGYCLEQLAGNGEELS